MCYLDKLNQKIKLTNYYCQSCPTSLITFAMRLYSKVRVNFGQDSVVDFDQLLYNLKSEYTIGFGALSSVDGGISLFIQRDAGSSPMALGKVKKVCSKVAHVVNIASFDTLEGEIIESFGDFRPRGRRVGIDVENVTEVLTPRVIEPQRVCTCTCREIAPPSTKSTFCAVYGSIDGTWTARFWVGPIESLGAKDKKRVTDDQRTVLLKRQNHLYQECSCSVFIGSYSNADIDHIIPRHLGGKTDVDNLQVICVPCHRSKTRLEMKGVKKAFPGLELDTGGSMYAVSNETTPELKKGTFSPLEYMRDPVGMMVMNLYST